MAAVAAATGRGTRGGGWSAGAGRPLVEPGVRVGGVLVVAKAAPESALKAALANPERLETP